MNQKEVNILVLSAGTRNKIIQYFKRALTDENGNRIGKVIATDMSDIAPAIYEADKFYIVPRITAPEYMDMIFDICRKESISGVLSLIDPELSILAKYEGVFRQLGVSIIGSSLELCERSLNKMQMYKWLAEHGYRTARSYVNKESFYKAEEKKEVFFPVFVKPIRGSASLEISKAKDRETVEFLFARSDNLMIQEYMHGTEIGADVYIDMLTGEIISIFTKRKIVMRAGETDKAVSFKEERLFELIYKFVKESGYKGQIDIDIFEESGEYYISEVNPRFGGGYPHAYECGCNHMKFIINNLLGITNKPQIGSYEEGLYMMKYNEIMIRSEEQ